MPDLVAGDPALDFANTLGGALEGPWDDEWLHGYGDLVAWACRAGLLDAATAAGLREHAERRPDEAGAAHAGAIALREHIYAAASALAQGREAPAAALAAVAESHRSALRHARLAAVPPGGARHDAPPADARPAGPHRGGDRTAALDWAWDDSAADLRRPLWPVALAAVDLFRSPQVERLKQCRNCRWVFLDASRNRSRRWCSMSHCGTDAKVRSLRARRARARDRRARAE